MPRRIHIFIAGDSTAATKQANRKPETGWGEKIEAFLTDEVEVCNFAVNGRSSKSFINEGRLQSILEAAAQGDCLFIQFGHNDEKEALELHTDPYTTYQDTLAAYVKKARMQGVAPVLLTPICRRCFSENGKLRDTHGEYPLAMRKLAIRLHVPLIDMTGISKALLEKLGSENSRELFLWGKPGEFPNYPQGIQDDTHFNDNGARQFAKLIVGELKKQKVDPVYRLVQ